MRTKSNQSRVTARIGSKLEKNLVAYMAAAGAAGVSLLAAQPVEAKVVYTATNTAVGNGTPIDLNNDGIADFTLGFHVLDKSIILTVDPIAKGNGVLCAADGGAAAGFGKLRNACAWRRRIASLAARLTITKGLQRKLT